MKPASKAVDSMVERFEQKVQNDMGHRPDMYVSDFKVLADDSSLILVRYSAANGTPTHSDLKTFVTGYFKRQLIPKSDTARVHTEQAAASLVVELSSSTQSIEAATKYIPIGGNLYLDKELQETWKVEQSDKGIQFLKRQTENNIGQILEARRQRMMAKSGMMKLNELFDMGKPTPGSVVTWYDGSGHYASGSVVELMSNSARVKIGDQRQTVPYSHIVSVDAAVDESKLIDYYKKAYYESKPELATELVKGKK